MSFIMMTLYNDYYWLIEESWLMSQNYITTIHQLTIPGHSLTIIRH